MRGSRQQSPLNGLNNFSYICCKSLMGSTWWECSYLNRRGATMWQHKSHNWDCTMDWKGDLIWLSQVQIFTPNISLDDFFLPFFGGSCPPRYFSGFPNVKTIWLIQNDQKNHYAFEKQQSEGKMANTLIHIEQMGGICELEFWLDRKKEESINHDAWKSI